MARPMGILGGECMAYRDILVERQDGVGTITLHRPDKLNAMTNQGWIELSEAVGELGQDPEVRALVITGAGRGFCAGQDVGHIGSIGSQAIMGVLHMMPAPAIIRCGKPTIAAINGVTSGGGLGLALACDIRIASDQARFNSSFILRGLARKLAKGPPLPLPLTKRLAYHGFAPHIEERCDLEMCLQYICFGSEDFRE